MTSSGSRWCPPRSAARGRRGRRARSGSTPRSRCPPCTCSALSVTRVSMSTAVSFAIEDSIGAVGRALPPSARAACRTSCRAASMSAAFSASAKAIACRAASGLPKVTRVARVLDRQLLRPPGQPDAGHRDRDPARGEEAAEGDLQARRPPRRAGSATGTGARSKTRCAWSVPRTPSDSPMSSTCTLGRVAVDQQRDGAVAAACVPSHAREQQPAVAAHAEGDQVLLAAEVGRCRPRGVDARSAGRRRCRRSAR